MAAATATLGVPRPTGSLPPPEGHPLRRPPRSRGPDLRNGGGGGCCLLPSAPTVTARPRAAAPPPCAHPGALPHGASGGGARGAPRVRALRYVRAVG
jgi:hypothetical protein